VGKSTLLRTIAGFQPPLAGNIKIEGRPVESFSDNEFAKTLSVVLTEKTDLRDLTAREVAALGRNPYTGFWGLLRQSDETAVDQALAMTGITHLADRPVNALSDGERQKTMLAKAIAQQTPIIVLDEPTAFLDFRSKIEIMRLLRRLAHEQNKTIFLATHDVELAMQSADRLWLLDADKGLTAGSPDELRNSGVIEQFFRCEGAVFDKNTGFFRIIN
jgi:iron complex transport system ATP-binding protein